VNAFNRQRKAFWLGLNHMADWSPAEKAKLRGRLHTPLGTRVPATVEHEASAAYGARGAALPAAVDWVAAGAVTPPKDQVWRLHSALAQLRDAARASTSRVG
jgi:hypothetical protein